MIKDDVERGLNSLDRIVEELDKIKKEMNKSLFKDGRDKAIEDINEKIEKSVFSGSRFEVKLITNKPAYYPIEMIDNSGIPFRKPVQINMRILDAEELILKLQKAVMDGKCLAKLDSRELKEGL